MGIHPICMMLRAKDADGIQPETEGRCPKRVVCWAVIVQLHCNAIQPLLYSLLALVRSHT